MRLDRGFRWIGAGVLVVGALAACALDPLGPLPPSLLEARIEGSIDSDYQGNGVFSTQPRGPFGFMLRSAGTGAARNEGFQFTSGAMPGVGTYPLGVADAPVRAQYSIREGNRMTLYEALSGALVVTAASADRFEGTFHFTARASAECDVSRPNLVSCTRIAGDESSPTIEITGSVEAVADRRRRFGP